MPHILDIITETMEHNCDTCAEQIVCFACDIPEKEDCEDWKPDFMEIQDRLEKIQKMIRERNNK